MRFMLKASLTGLLLVAAWTMSADARRAAVQETDRDNAPLAAGQPIYCLALHNVGNIVLPVNNNATLGRDYTASGTSDCFTGESAPNSCEFPKGSRTQYLFGGAFWIGAIKGRDTLVSTGQDGWSTQGSEFHPDDIDGMVFRSTLDPTKPEFEGAISEQDYIAVYYDTCRGCSGVTADAVRTGGHLPLGLKITQRSFCWSYAYAEDIVLFDYAIENISSQRLRNVYMGVYIDADVHDQNVPGGDGATDDLCGFLQAIEASYAPVQCPALDTVNIAWIADNDGDFSQAPLYRSVPNVTATRVVRTPSDSLQVGFNWWVGNSTTTLDVGPQSQAKFRLNVAGGSGTPEGDAHKYWNLSNGEFDYDQAFTAVIPPSDTYWAPLPNPTIAPDIADGYDTRYLLSFGPFGIDPGQTLPLSFAYLGGENLVPNQNILQFLPSNPDEFYAALNFEDLGYNATWASWIYDNPGVDTDSDGYFGKFRTCVFDSSVDTTEFDTTVTYLVVDTTYYEGDGVPDFRGASPPPPPFKWIEPSVGKIKIRFNGQLTENIRDVFSRELDFEGYRIYKGRDDRPSSFELLTSFDLENFNKFVYNRFTNLYELSGNPFTLQNLQNIYGGGSSSWDPLSYTRSSPLRVGDSSIYFEKQDFNRSLADAGIKYRYDNPRPPKPPEQWNLLRDSVPADSVDIYLTEDGYFKYYEYEYELNDLLPSVSYFVNVTAFDYGSPITGLPPLESSVSVAPAEAYPLASNADIAAGNLEVFVYPNPYRLDADYIGAGYERQDQDVDVSDERLRRVHFANLPPKCTIKIFSLDGDLIKEIVHDIDPSSTLANHEVWDLISRNNQLVVSGIYYWTVEAPDRETQIGKLVLIL